MAAEILQTIQIHCTELRCRNSAVGYTNKIQQKVIKQWIQDAKFCNLLNGLKYLDSLNSDTCKLQKLCPWPNLVPRVEKRDLGNEVDLCPWIKWIKGIVLKMSPTV